MEPIRLNVLVADDEMAVAKSVSLTLRLAGHSVDVVQDADTAFLKISQVADHYQLLITDHAMGKVSGLELVKKLRKIRFPGKIIVISGYLTPQLEKAYRELDVSAIIHKPFEVVELRKAVQDLAASWKP